MRNYKYILIAGAVGSGIFRNLWPPLSSLNYLLRNQITLRGHRLATYLPLGLTEKPSGTALTPMVGEQASEFTNPSRLQITKEN